MRNRLPFLVLLALPSLAACSLLTDLGGLSGGREGDAAAPVAQDGAPLGDAAVADAVGRDATDATADGCVVPGLVTRICDDFERTSAKGAWGSLVEGTGASASIEVDPITNSRVLVTRAPASVTGYESAYVNLLTTTKGRVRWTASIKVKRLPTVKKRQVVVVRFTDTATGNVAQEVIALTASGLQVAEQTLPAVGSGDVTPHDSTIPVVVGMWMRVSLGIDVRARTIEFLVDDKDALPPSSNFGLLASFAGTGVGVTVGPRYSDSPSDEFSLSSDDIVFATDE